MKYFTLLTIKGAEKIAAATAANKTIALTYIALGDGNGTIPMPDASKTALVNETYRASLNDLRVDANNRNWVVAEAYVPAGEGNFWIREVGVFDADGDLIAIGNYPETFKPVTADGVAKDLYMKVIFEVSSSDAITLQVDPSIVMASQEYVNEKLKEKADISYVDAKPTGMKNLLINGCFRVWQRGTSHTFGEGLSYGAMDRWRAQRVVVQKAVTTLYGEAVNLSKNGSLENSMIETVIENSGEYFQDKNMVLSFYVKASTPITGAKAQINNAHQSNFSPLILLDATYDIGTSWERKEIKISKKTGSFVDFRVIPLNVTIPDGASIDIAQVQLELGTKATEFEYRPYGLELSLCQRYYEKDRDNHNLYGRGNSAALRDGQISFKVEKRIVPTITFWDTENCVGGTSIASSSGVSTKEIRITASATNSGSRSSVTGYTADAEIY